MGRNPRPQQLPPGRHGLSADQVASNQHERILTAVARSIGAAGYAKTTVEDIIKLAGVSRKTFYQHFSNKEDAFLAAYDIAASRVVGEIEQAYTAHGDYESSARTALECCLRVLADDPDVAMMLIVEVFAAGPKALERRSANLRQLTEVVAARTSDLVELPPGASLAAEAVVGGILEVIYNRVQRGEAEQLPDYLPDLLYCVLAPFVGHERAAAERSEAARVVTRG